MVYWNHWYIEGKRMKFNRLEGVGMTYMTRLSFQQEVHSLTVRVPNRRFLSATINAYDSQQRETLGARYVRRRLQRETQGVQP